MYTANDGGPDRDEAMRLGASGWIRKAARAPTVLKEIAGWYERIGGKKKSRERE
jgi:hypothetical protein